MKKLFLITCFLSSILMLNAKAVEFKPYIGANIGYVTNHTLNSGDNGDFKDKTKLGINFGSKMNIDDDKFLFGEIYVNIINKDTEAKGEEPLRTSINVYKATFKNLYGLNFGFGHNFNEKFNAKIFASIDAIKLKTDNTDIDINTGALLGGDSFSKTKFGLGLGVDLGYNVTEDIEVKLGYKFSNTLFHFKEDVSPTRIEEYSIKLRTHVINLGLAYNF